MPSEKQPAPGVGNAVQAAADVGRARGHSQCPARRGRWGTVWATPLDFCYASVRNEPGERGWPCQMAPIVMCQPHGMVECFLSTLSLSESTFRSLIDSFSENW